MSCIFYFYAQQDEVIRIWEWLWNHPNCTIVEMDSRLDQPLRDVVIFPGNDLVSSGKDFSLCALPTNVGAEFSTRWIDFNQKGRQFTNARGRWIRISPAVIRIHKLDAPDNLLGPYQLIFETEKIAMRQLIFESKTIECVDWLKHGKFVNELKKEIRNQFGLKWRNYPVSENFNSQSLHEGKKLWLWGKVGNPTPKFVV